MRETGEEFEAEVLNLRAGAIAFDQCFVMGELFLDSAPEVRSWSVWSYWLVEQPEIEAIPLVATANTERPERLFCQFGKGAAVQEVHLLTPPSCVSPARTSGLDCDDFGASLTKIAWKEALRHQ